MGCLKLTYREIPEADFFLSSEKTIGDAGNRSFWDVKSDHLGNVRVVLSDARNSVGLTSVTAAYDYYPFGMIARSIDGGARFLFNGMEREDNITGVAGGHYDFGARIYDPRLGRFLSVDPKWKNFAFLSSYSFAANNPIKLIDRNGEDPTDPRTGKAYPINLSYAVVLTNDFKPGKHTPKKDQDLSDDSSPGIFDAYNFDSGGGIGFNDIPNPMLVYSFISSDAAQELGYESYPGIAAPNKSGFNKVAQNGYYTFIDDVFAERTTIFSDKINKFFMKGSFNIVKVEANVVKQITNMKLNSEHKYDINFVQTLDVKYSDVKTRTESTWWGGNKQVKYRDVTTTETTKYYENNKESGKVETNTSTREEIVK